jgi:hypothetical protein
MTAASDSDAFYASLPVRRGSRSLMDAGRYTPLPDGWTIGIADVVAPTKAIAEKRYKAVNMAGAAVIAALTNALGGREFPFVFGGDGGLGRRRAWADAAGGPDPARRHPPPGDDADADEDQRPVVAQERR